MTSRTTYVGILMGFALSYPAFANQLLARPPPTGRPARSVAKRRVVDRVRTRLELDGRSDKEYRRPTTILRAPWGATGASEVTAAPQAGRIATAFADHRRLDRNFFLLMVALIWLGILMRFVPEIVGRFQAHKPPFPAVVYFHGVVFVSWLCLLTAQVLLIRSRRVDLHRELGMAGTPLYAAMIVLGVTTSVVVDYRSFGKTPIDPSFFSIQLADMVNFAALGRAAIALRKNPEAHKRLMILATICVANAGRGRG